MKFIKKKNLIAGEVLLNVPTLHWMYTVKYAVLFLLLIPVLFIVRAILSYNPLTALASSYSMKVLDGKIMLLTLGIVIIALLILAWRSFLYLSVEYGVTNKRLLMKKGIFRVVTAEIPMDRIESIYCTQGILGKIFNYGTIYISGIGGRMPVFFMVVKPYALRRKIAGIIEKNKAITVIHGDPPKPPPPPPDPPKEPIEYGTFVRIPSNCCEKKGD